MTPTPTPTYVSLFSSAGLGCFGFKLEGFECLASAELLAKRLNVQIANHVAKDESSYFQLDLSKDDSQREITDHVTRILGKKNLDVLVATPPCQGMSVANHKKSNELPRNSLVMASINMVSRLKPKVFVFENVRAFLKSSCLDNDGKTKTIEEAIFENLAGDYVIDSKILNLKDYGSPSSRTRTLVIGIRNNYLDISPTDLFPERAAAPSLKTLIGHLPRLSKMGQIDPNDLYHSFRSYDTRMLPWIKATKRNASAFENKDPWLRPHQEINGEIVENQAKNGDKYKRQNWELVAPCVHTRNDILASQNTVHPSDNRVFSIRELMLMMGVPNSFKWTQESEAYLNALDVEQKALFLKKHELNIRQCLGEGVPTPVFRSIAKKFNEALGSQFVSKDSEAILSFEAQNPRKKELAAFYTRKLPAFQLVTGLGKRTKRRRVRILEPSAGAGSFLIPIFEEFAEFSQVELDLIELDPKAVALLSKRLRDQPPPENFRVNVICSDFLEFDPKEKYDFVIGNPPFGKTRLGDGRNLVAQFVEKCFQISTNVALIVPKVFLSGPDYSSSRRALLNSKIHKIIDYGQAAFADVKIETIGLDVERNAKVEKSKIISWIGLPPRSLEQSYFLDTRYPSWLIYRNEYFDLMSNNLDFDVFTPYRDRSITKADLDSSGTISLVRGKDIKVGQITIDEPELRIFKESVPSSTAKYLNVKNALVVPNLTYYTRAARLPRNSVPDGSAALLLPKNGVRIPDYVVRFFGSEDFFRFYRIAMNYSTRTLNVDKTAAFYWGIPSKELLARTNYNFAPTPKNLFGN